MAIEATPSPPARGWCQQTGVPGHTAKENERAEPRARCDWDRTGLGALNGPVPPTTNDGEFWCPSLLGAPNSRGQQSSGALYCPVPPTAEGRPIWSNRPWPIQYGV